MNRIARKNQFSPGKKNIRGAVAVEMAILLIPLIVMAVGVAEFGRAIYQYNTLVKAVRDAGRLLSQHAPGSVNYATYIAEARCLAVHGNVNCSGAPLAAGLTTGMVTVASSTTLSSAGTTINLVEVGITGYQFDFVFNPLAFFGNTDTGITFGPIQTTMRQI